MKTIFIVLLSISSAALACPRTENNFLCSGDKIADMQGNTGTVIAINPNTETAVINWDSYSNNTSEQIRDLAVQEGCTSGLCVQDKIADASGDSGQVIAVNPYNRKVVISWDKYSNKTAVSVEGLAMDHGCVKNVCVHDRGADQNGDTGVVGYVNKYDQTIVVMWDKYANATSIAAIDFALEKDCASGGNTDDSYSNHGGDDFNRPSRQIDPYANNSFQSPLPPRDGSGFNFSHSSPRDQN